MADTEAPVKLANEEDARGEGRLLAEEMAHSAARFAKSCWENFKKSPVDLVSCPEGRDEDEFLKERRERLMDATPENLQWWDLQQIAWLDTGLATAKWQEVKQHARDGLQLGYRASQFVQGGYAGPMERARFLALRESLMDEWRPRGGVEQALIDMMAQAFTMWEHWTETATGRVLRDCHTSKRDEEDARYWKRPLQTEADGIAMANEQADRWNRIFLRTLRQLRDLRRYSVSIVNAGQVNIAQQQVNVAESATSVDT